MTSIRSCIDVKEILDGSDLFRRVFHSYFGEPIGISVDLVFSVGEDFGIVLCVCSFLVCLCFLCVFCYKKGGVHPFYSINTRIFIFNMFFSTIS